MYDVHQIVTDKILAAIEAGGLAPWHKSWSGSSGGAAASAPVNGATGRRYSGVNVLTLWAAATCHGHTSGSWLTRKQAEDLGATLKVGHGKLYEPIVWCERKAYGTNRDGSPVVDADGNPDTRDVFVTRYSFVYNAGSFDNLPARVKGAPVVPAIPGHAGVQAIVQGLAVPVHHGGDRACYRHGLNDEEIRMPLPQSFTSPDAYHATLLHELTHATGHRSRCNRDLSGSFGSHKYAAEELVAELGAAFACAYLGIDSEPRADHASYIEHWMRAMKADKKAIFVAAAKASAAAKYLYNVGGIDATAEEVQAAK